MALEWVKDSVFYQIFPDRFARSSEGGNLKNLEKWDSPPSIYGFKGGNLGGVIEKLDYLQDLGINAIYFNPIFTSTANHRYHTINYFEVDPLLGGDEMFSRLLKEAHARKIRVILDGVFNHTGRGFFPFSHIIENGIQSPFTDWFCVNDEWLSSGRMLNAYPEDYKKLVSTQGDPSLATFGYKAWWNLPQLPKLNTGNPEVREMILSTARYWIEQGVDGWRLDVPGEIDDDSFWRQFRDVVKRANPEAYIVGEIWGDARRWLKGDQFDAVMNYVWTKSVIGFFIARFMSREEIDKTAGFNDVKQMNLSQFSASLDELLGWYSEETNLLQFNLLDSHDTPRFFSLAGHDERLMKLAILFQFTYPGAPCVYYGDEVGLDGGSDPECRKGFPWKEVEWNQQIREQYKKCIALRNRSEALRRGNFKRLYADRDLYAFSRTSSKQKAYVTLNLSREKRFVGLDTGEMMNMELQDAFSGEKIPCTNGKIRDFEVLAQSGRVLIGV